MDSLQRKQNVVVSQDCVPGQIMSVLRTGKHSDIKLILRYCNTDRAIIPVHRIVLEACCKPLYSLIEEQDRKTGYPVSSVVITDITDEKLVIYQGLISAMYTGKYKFEGVNPRMVQNAINRFFSCFDGEDRDRYSRSVKILESEKPELKDQLYPLRQEMKEDPSLTSDPALQKELEDLRKKVSEIKTKENNPKKESPKNPSPKKIQKKIKAFATEDSLNLQPQNIPDKKKEISPVEHKDQCPLKKNKDEPTKEEQVYCKVLCSPKEGLLEDVERRLKRLEEETKNI